MITQQNIWGSPGSNLDAQRSDLWTIDLTPVYSLVTNPTGVSITPEYQDLLDTINAGGVDISDCVSKVTLPETILDVIDVITGSQHRVFPKYDVPLTNARVDFWLEVPENSSSTPDESGSKVYAILACWHMLAMAGQQRTGRTLLPLTDASARPEIHCNLKLTFLNGGGVDGNGRNIFQEGASYVIYNTWMPELQLNDVSHSEGVKLSTATATLCASSIQLL